MGKLGMPRIDIAFKQLSASIIERSGKGRLALILADETADKPKWQLFKELSEVVSGDFSEDNARFIKEAFIAGANEVLAVRIKKTETVQEHAVPILKGQIFDWVALAVETKALQDEVANFVIAFNKNTNRKIKGLVYNATDPDNMHVVNFVTSKFYTDDFVENPGWKLIPRIAGLLAGVPFNMAATYWKVPGVVAVEEPQDLDAAVNGGKLFLFNDIDVIRVARGVNSLVTIDANHTDDMKSIAVVETMDLIMRDIHEAFKVYIGKFKNKYDNQCLFITAVNAYFAELATKDILDNKYDNHCTVDVAAQRQAWQAVKPEAAKWSDEQIRSSAFKREVFLLGKIKVLDAVEDLTFTINMV